MAERLKVCDGCYIGFLNGKSFIGYKVKNQRTKDGTDCCNCGEHLSETEKSYNALDN